jgi:hypothetical protein
MDQLYSKNTNSSINGFIDITEEDTPYFHFVRGEYTPRNLYKPEVAKGRETESMGNSFKNESGGQQYSKTDSETTKRSKNSIFEMDHRILKPSTKMNEQELQALRKGVTGTDKFQNFSGARSETDSLVAPIPIPKAANPLEGQMASCSPLNSMYIPLSFPIRPATPVHKESASPEPTAFLLADTCERQMANVLENIRQKPLGDRGVYLSFLPIAKNFLGRGVNANVYLGHFSFENDETEYPCAVKRCNTSQDSLRSAITEIHLLSKVRNPYIIALIDFKDENGMNSTELAAQIPDIFRGVCPVPPNLSVLAVLEYCSKGNMWDWMRKHESDIGPKLWLKWAKQIAGGLQCIHSLGIVHHDIKPHNILVFFF